MVTRASQAMRGMTLKRMIDQQMVVRPDLLEEKRQRGVAEYGSITKYFVMIDVEYDPTITFQTLVHSRVYGVVMPADKRKKSRSQGFIKHDIVFSSQQSEPLVVGDVDLYYATDLDNIKSTTGRRHIDVRFHKITEY
nr:hypothetical protein Iba_chr12cCG15840 [Ipomoea batatas]